jgi:mannitol-specific phosphotransferase system IIBC component
MEVATAPAPGNDAEVTSDHPTSAPRAALFRLVLLGVLVLALVASVISAVVLFSHRHGDSGNLLQSDREAAMVSTQQFVLRVNTYGPSLLDSSGQMPEYRSRVKAVITPKFAVSFDQGVQVAEQSVKNYGVDRTCAVFATGVEQIDSDSAQVLVAGSFSETLKNKSGKRVSAGEPAPFRLRVSLDKIDGHWLVDDYQTVTS